MLYGSGMLRERSSHTFFLTTSRALLQGKAEVIENNLLITKLAWRKIRKDSSLFLFIFTKLYNLICLQ